MNGKTFRNRLLATSVFAGVAFAVAAAPVVAQEDEAVQDVVIVTGTRIQAPGLVSSSPIATVGQQELAQTQTIEIERLFKDLPITVPGDGQNVNNGTVGATTIDLRNLGPKRTLIMVDGKRMTPFDYDAEVDVSAIPVNALERVDIVTGGASAVYGSDAMAGAINFITKSDFAGIELSANVTQTDEQDGDIYNLGALFGANLDGDRGNVMLAMNYTERKAVLLAARDIGLFGISTANGPAPGGAPASPQANCDAPNVTLASTGVGSTTSIPAALDLVSGTRQFQNDGTLADRCSRFNFNPFNYYQTPQERFNMMATARYDIAPGVEAYGRANFSAINVVQQVAPSGAFGNVFEVPLQNPFLTASARQTILDDLNNFAAANPALTFTDLGINDLNNNGIFDANDSITVPIRRRTLEFGTRSSNYDSNNFQLMMGVRGDIFGDWDYDVSYQHGEADRTEVRAGYTNVSNMAIALNTVDATQCITPGGSVTNGCVPLDLFSTGFGSITAAQAAYSTATAIEKRDYVQDILAASIAGPLDMLKSPYADLPLNVAFGVEYRQEQGSSTPDECLKEAPTSCQGGAGGNRLPVSSSFDVYEAYAEAIVPIASGIQGFEDLSLELGYRSSDYSSVGTNETWKIGLNWEIVDGFRVRVMQQQAARAPNIGELGAPVTTGLTDAAFDPCSNGNPGTIDATLAALCVSTGVVAPLVGLVGDIVSSQISDFRGTDLNALPDAEVADTFTAGFVWTPNMDLGPFEGTQISVDYFDIEISDYIDRFSAQEVLDNCYILGDPAECAKINRINGSLATSGAGVNRFTTNLDFLRTEGIDIQASTGVDLGEHGALDFSFYGTVLSTQESQSSATVAVIDCLGIFGNDCNPSPELRFSQRSTWSKGPYKASILWRHMGSVDIQDSQKASTFDAFESIDAYNYFDFAGSYDLNDSVRFSLNVRNITAEEPPVVGNGAGSTSFNSGNTFPSSYDVFGRVYTIGVTGTF